MLNSDLVFTLTLQRKAENRERPRRRDANFNEWVFENESDLDLSASPDVLPEVALVFLDELREVESFAEWVRQGIMDQDKVALLRPILLEQAFYLYLGEEESLRSPSFRFGYYLRLLRRLRRGVYRFNLEARLQETPYPTDAYWRRR